MGTPCRLPLEYGYLWLTHKSGVQPLWGLHWPHRTFGCLLSSPIPAAAATISLTAASATSATSAAPTPTTPATNLVLQNRLGSPL